MFTSRGVPLAQGLAGTVMNTVTFYIVRFSAPLVGFVLLAVLARPPGLRWLELVSVAVAVAITVGLLLVIHSEALAGRLGATGARLVGRVGRRADQDAWARACLDFRAHVARLFARGFPRSLLAYVAMLTLDLTMLVCSLRFVGVSAAEVPLIEIAVAYSFACPFTLFPLSGLGVVDALILAAVVVDVAGQGVEAATVAGLVVWRTFTVLGPVTLGLGAVGWWRHEQRGRGAGPDLPG